MQLVAQLFFGENTFVPTAKLASLSLDIYGL